MASEVKEIKSYTKISNSILRRKIGIKAMGLMSFMISLPKNWDYSVKGLAKCTGDGEKSVKKTLKKLEALGYLTRIRERDEKGCFTKNKYILYSEPRVVKKNKETQNFCSSFENIDAYPEAQKVLVDKNVPEVQKVLVDKNAKKYRTTFESIGAYPRGQKVLMDKNSPEVQKVLVDKNAKKRRIALENIAVYPGGQNALAEKGRQINTKEINTKINNKKERKENLNDNSLFKRENKNEIKKISAEKNSTEKKKISFDEIIENYTQNEKLRAELKEHLRVRKAKRAALTDHALELSLKRLDSIANSDEEKIEIVQNAIMRGWTTFYPLRSSYNINSYEKTMVKTNSVFSASNYNIDNYEKTMDVFDAQVKKEEERRKAKAEARAKVIELAEKEHEENVRKYDEKYAQELEESEDLEEYKSTKDYFNHLLAKGCLLDGTRPPEPKNPKHDLFENIENEEEYFAPPQMPLTSSRTHESVLTR